MAQTGAEQTQRQPVHWYACWEATGFVPGCSYSCKWCAD